MESESYTPRNRRRKEDHIVKNKSSNHGHREAYETSPDRESHVNGILQHQNLKKNRFTVTHNHHDHDEATGESDSAYGSGQNSRQTSREKRTARLHLGINRNNEFHPKQVSQSDHNSACGSTEILNSEYRNSSKQRNSQSRSSGSYSYSPPVTSGKRKTFYMMPNLQNVSDVYNSSGNVLCEKLFGIILCQYKHRPLKPNGSNLDQILRDRKVIVQALVPDSQAHVCGHIHRGKQSSR